VKGLVSFHPVDLEFFDGLIAPLVAGEKVNPEVFVEIALRLRETVWLSQRYLAALETLREQIEPPPPPEDGTMWDKVRTRLERFDHRPDALVRTVAQRIDPEMHLHGRPFLITEGSAEGVGSVADEFLEAHDEDSVVALIAVQLVRVSRELPRELEPAEFGELPPQMAFRTELLAALKEIFDLAQAVRKDEHWGEAGGPRRPAAEVLAQELPWRAVDLHSRAVPFWIARDVDGLATICRAADVTPPDCLVPAGRLVVGALESFPELALPLGTELGDGATIGGFVAPADVDQLLSFLNAEGSRIIQAATRQGVGSTCSSLLRKIRECAQYAARHGAGYVEAGGIEPIGYATRMSGPALKLRS
jgi:hypothetical protein